MRILVTGGWGVNGSWVVRRLMQRHHDVVVLENRDDRSLIPDLADDVCAVSGDVSDVDAVRAVIDEYRSEVVIHMAAVLRADHDPLTALAVNVGGTAAVCEAAATGGVTRVVHTSSRSAYGALEDRHGHPGYVPVTEDHPCRPVGLYDVTRRSGEEIGRWYGRNRGIEFVSLRFASILGPGKRRRHGAFGVYSSIVELPAAGVPVWLPRGGDQRDDLIYVLDAADAVVAAALAPGRLPHDVYNIGTGRAVRLHDLAEVVRDAIPGATIEIGPGLDPLGVGISYYGALDSSRARRDLNWAPQFSLVEAVAHHLRTLDRIEVLGALPSSPTTA